MIDSLPWRKMSVSVSTDAKIRYIDKKLPPRLCRAAFVFYLHAFCCADDDGAFDIEDGCIFADVLNCEPEDITLLAAQFCARGILCAAAADSTVYILNDWESPNRNGKTSAPLTLAERRARVASKIAAEGRRAAPQQSVPTMQPRTPPQAVPTAAQIPAQTPPPSVPHSAEAVFIDFNSVQKSIHQQAKKTAENAFFCPDDDKNAKNVANTEIRETEEISQTEIRETEEKERHTHTEESAAALAAAALQAATAAQPQERERERERAAQESDTREREKERREFYADTQKPCAQHCSSAPYAAADTQNERNITAPEKKKENAVSDTFAQSVEVLEVLTDFFMRENPLGFPDAETEAKALNCLSNRIYPLATSRNPARICAGVFVSQFKKLTETDKYYKNMPLLPSKMVIPANFSRVFADAQRILQPKENRVNWTQYQQKLEAEAYTAESPLEYLCRRAGIDPADPDAAHKLLIQKQYEKGEKHAVNA